jgi:hypothetical protein
VARPTIAPDVPAQKLREELDGNLKFILKHADGDKDRAARIRAVETLTMLNQFLRDLGVTPSLTRPLDDILDAFVEADRGHLLPLFMPKKIAHRPPLELKQLWIMMKASLAIDLLMKANKTKEQAAREVAKQLRKYGIAIEGNLDKQDWETVVGWREKLRKASGHPDVVWCSSFYKLQKEARLRQVAEHDSEPRTLAIQELQSLDPRD